MTTLFEDTNASPGTHVLAIGVGKYLHLPDGGGRLAQKRLGLRQLTSPPVSAKAVVDWCLAPRRNPGAVGFRNPDCPLASVEAVISGDADVPIVTPAGSVAPDRATLGNIQTAFGRWLQRLQRNDGNVGVFYFCGHGILVNDHYLLAEDFGADDNQPWDKAFDVSKTLRAVQRDAKGSLYFFIDACKQISTEVALTLGADPRALKAVDLNKPVISRAASLIQAAGEGKLAFAPTGRKVARFTEALLTSMSGFCGVQASGQQTWDVDGELLASSIRKLLESGNRTVPVANAQVSEQRISGSSVPLLRLNAAPRVKVELDLLPAAHRARALMYLLSAKGAKFEQQREDKVFLVEVPRGFYSVGASASAEEFAEILYEDQELAPPLYGLTMQVQP